MVSRVRKGSPEVEGMVTGQEEALVLPGRLEETEILAGPGHLVTPCPGPWDCLGLWGLLALLVMAILGLLGPPDPPDCPDHQTTLPAVIVCWEWPGTQGHLAPLGLLGQPVG